MHKIMKYVTMIDISFKINRVFLKGKIFRHQYFFLNLLCKIDVIVHLAVIDWLIPETYFLLFRCSGTKFFWFFKKKN